MIDSQQKAREIEVLDKSTTDLLQSIRKTNRKLAFAGFAFFAILFIVGIYGIYEQVNIARSSKAHIDCIVQLFRTQTPNTNDRRYITNINQCHIEVVKAS